MKEGERERERLPLPYHLGTEGFARIKKERKKTE